MASKIPARRSTRLTRPARKDTENATARPPGPVTRSKPPPVADQAPLVPVTRIAAATTASKAKAINCNENSIDPLQGKRKREALASKPPTEALKGKEPVKEKFDGVVITKLKSVSSKGNRQPLRTVADSTSRRASKAKATASQPQTRPLKEVAEVSEDIAPAQDTVVPSGPHTAANYRLVHQPSAAVASAVIKQEVQRDKLAKRSSSHLTITNEIRGNDRLVKKRRVLSDVSEEPKLTEEQEEPQTTLDAVPESRIESESEADPDGDEWEDLDAGDVDDPLMVSEYVNEIFDYMKRVEVTTLPNPDYMSNQKELEWSMRGILLDWLVQVHTRFRLLPETFFLCVNIIDRFLSTRVVSLTKLQLVGITSLFIASKVEEIVAPSVSHFLHCADSSYTESEILIAERYVLKTIDWNMSYPNPMHFLRRISKADDYDLKTRTIGKYLLEVGTLERRLLSTPPSLMAAAAIWLARLILCSEKWTANLAHYSSYSESALLPTANLMLNYILEPIRHESFHRKYAAKRFLKVSIWVRGWALDRWSEGTRVSLRDDLPRLKTLARNHRQRLEPLADGGEPEGNDNS